MSPNEHTAARLASPTGGGFEIVRRGEAVRLDSVAAEIIDRLADQIGKQQRRINSDREGKAKTSAGHFSPRGAASVSPTKPEMRAGVAHCFSSQGQGTCSA